MTPITKTIRRVTIETYGYGKRARKLVAAFERGDLISIREFGCRTQDAVRIYDVLWWMKRSKADKIRMEKLRERKWQRRRDWPRGGNAPPRSGCSTDNETIAGFIHLQPAAGIFSGEQVLGQRIADLLFNGVAHRTRTELGMKSFSHKERQNCFIQFQCVTARGKKLNFPRQKLFGNLQLMFIAQATEHQFFSDAGENFRAQRLLRP